jgi:hypothetical protein
MSLGPFGGFLPPAFWLLPDKGLAEHSLAQYTLSSALFAGCCLLHLL